MKKKNYELLGTFQLNQGEPIHGWYNYLAGYSAEFVREYVLEHRVTKDDLVFDPFTGCGTTLVTCKELGIPSLGIEINPFMHFVTQTKLHWDFSISELKSVKEKIINEIVNAGSIDVDLLEIPAFISKAFSPAILQKLMIVKKTVERVENRFIRNLFLLGLITILRPVSNYKNWAPYPEPRKTPLKDVDIYSLFKSSIERMIGDIELITSKPRHSISSEVILGDARDIKTIFKEKTDADKVKFVLTSPPYLNNWDYGWITRIELFFSGHASSQKEITEKVRNKLIKSSTYILQNVKRDIEFEFSFGGIRQQLEDLCQTIENIQKTKKNPKLYTIVLKAYFNDMFKVLKGLYWIMAEGARCCIIVGDSGMYGTHVATDSLLYDLSEQVGFNKAGLRILRERRATRHPLKLRESVIILEK
ncbi:MAG: DNA methyltransferase [Candidatus Hodarchaeales archaeon]